MGSPSADWRTAPLADSPFPNGSSSCPRQAWLCHSPPTPSTGALGDMLEPSCGGQGRQLFSDAQEGRVSDLFMPLGGTLGTGGTPGSALTFTLAWPRDSSDAPVLLGAVGPATRQARGLKLFLGYFRECTVVLTKPWASSVPACAQGAVHTRGCLFSSRVSAINIRQVHSPSCMILLCL